MLTYQPWPYLSYYVIMSNGIILSMNTFQEAVEHAQATGHVNFQEYRW